MCMCAALAPSAAPSHARPALGSSHVSSTWLNTNARSNSALFASLRHCITFRWQFQGFKVCAASRERIQCSICNRSFSKSGLPRHKCTEERRKPVADQAGSRHCMSSLVSQPWRTGRPQIPGYAPICYSSARPNHRFWTIV